ncbi:hypothetical protein A6A07_15585 [Streptomyces sp. CB03911]|nr:hypothetical protein A6A07_15585 [Streptomyces sp. CB03911]
MEDLRLQLYQAQDKGRREQFRFEVEKAELHLEVQVRKDATGKAKLSIGAAGAEAGGAAGQSRTHKLVLVLNVRDGAVNGPLQIGDEVYRSSAAQNPGGAGSGGEEGAVARNPERDGSAVYRPRGDAESRTDWRG